MPANSFLKIQRSDDGYIYMKIPEGLKKFYPQQDTWLQIKKPMCGLNNQDYTTKREPNEQFKLMDLIKAKLIHGYSTPGETNMVIATPIIVD